MSEVEFTECLADFLHLAAEDESDESFFLEGASVRFFWQDQVLTRNNGFTLKLPSGDEFQIAVVQSKFGESEDEK